MSSISSCSLCLSYIQLPLNYPLNLCVWGNRGKWFLLIYVKSLINNRLGRLNNVTLRWIIYTFTLAFLQWESIIYIMPVIKMVVIIPNSMLYSIFKEKDEIDTSHLFESKGFGGFKMLKSFGSTLYLGCDHTGEVTLVENPFLLYPNPQTLFILYKVRYWIMIFILSEVSF